MYSYYKPIGDGSLKGTIKRLCSMILISALVLTMPTLSSAKPLKKTDIDYVSLGDSLAAGQTPYGEIKSGYADFLFKRMEQSQYEVDFTNFGVPGYTSAQLLNGILYDNAVKDEIKSADMITLNIGANDVLGLLKSPQHVPGAIRTVGQNLMVILATIDSLNPDVDVYVMGYYNPFPHLSLAEQSQLIPVMHALNNTIEAVSSMNGDIFVPTADVIAENPMHYIPNPEDIHLSLDGYKVIAKEFWKVLDKSNKKK